MTAFFLREPSDELDGRMYRHVKRWTGALLSLADEIMVPLFSPDPGGLYGGASVVSGVRKCLVDVTLVPPVPPRQRGRQQ